MWETLLHGTKIYETLKTDDVTERVVFGVQFDVFFAFEM